MEWPSTGGVAGTIHAAGAHFIYRGDWGRRVAGIDTKGRVLWERSLKVALRAVWRHGAETRGLVSADGRAGQIVKIAADGTLLPIGEIEFAGREDRLGEIAVYPSGRAAWWAFEGAGRLAHTWDRMVGWQGRLPQPEHGHAVPRGTAGLADGGLLVVEAHAPRGARGSDDYRWSVARYARSGRRRLVLEGDHRIAAVASLPDGRAAVLQDRPGQLHEAGLAVWRQMFGARLTPLDAAARPGPPVDLQVPWRCRWPDHDRLGHLTPYADGFLATGRTCAYMDSVDGWVVALHPDLQVRWQRRIRLGNMTSIGAAATNETGTIALAGLHRRCCYDTVGDGTAFVMLVDRAGECLLGDRPAEAD